MTASRKPPSATIHIDGKAHVVAGKSGVGLVRFMADSFAWVLRHFGPEDLLEVRPADVPDYVSRAGHKLAGALAAFPDIGVAGKRCLDAGASTGGFTDYLLQHGVARVIAESSYMIGAPNDPQAISLHDFELQAPVSGEIVAGVIYLQSTSKTLAPTFRTGWVLLFGGFVCVVTVVGGHRLGGGEQDLDRRPAAGAAAPQLARVPDDELIPLVALGVSPAYIRELAGAGVEELDRFDRRRLGVGAPGGGDGDLQQVLLAVGVAEVPFRRSRPCAPAHRAGSGACSRTRGRESRRGRSPSARGARPRCISRNARGSRG